MLRVQYSSLFAIVGVTTLIACTHVAFAQSGAPQAGASDKGPYRIAGTAVDGKTGAPLARARITIVNAKHEQDTQTFISTEDGRFEFRVPAGKYSLRAGKHGYMVTGYDQHEQFWTAIVTGAGLDTEHLTLRVTPAAVLYGKVLDENGDPVREATVTVYFQNHVLGISQIRRWRTAQVDDQGMYEVPNLDAGVYFVGVQANPWYAVHTNASALAENLPTDIDPSLDVAYPVTYYGDVTESDEATPIPVRGGDRLEADIHLNPAPALHLLFQVPEDGARGLNVPDLQRPAFDDVEGVPNRSVQQVSPGVFEITGVPAGRYMVRMPDAEGQFEAPMAIDLTSSQELKGSSGTATAKVSFKVHVAGAENPPSEIGIGLRTSKGAIHAGRVDDKGNAEIANLIPGKYTVTAWSRGDVFSVAGMSNDSGPIPGRTLNVEPGAALSVSIRLVGGSVKVDGFAKRSGQAAPGAMIVLVPKNPEENPDLFRRDQSDLDGSFTLQNVVPGSYSVIAIQDGWDLDWATPAVLAHYGRHAQPLTVPMQARGTVRLPNPVEVEAR